MTSNSPPARAPRYWKVLDANGRACHGGAFQYDLPTWHRTKGWVPGAWTPRIADVKACTRGYHVCRDDDLLYWLHERIYLCEVRGSTIAEDNKVVAESVRLLMPTPWDAVSARLFAVECVADVLSPYEAQHPNDARVSDCLEVAYRFALGDASDNDRAAARAAADSAAYAAAGAAAYAAADSAAYTAAGAAARAAARAAAESAAWTAQTQRLLWWMGVTV